jgi:hypothetical protein
MTTPRERIAKGSNLEKAVQLIEDAILRASPALKKKAFTIERNKIMAVAGVHHEIDVWVEIDAGKGYNAVFIFECKNWQDKVGKNEIIVFGEDQSCTGPEGVLCRGVVHQRRRGTVQVGSSHGTPDRMGGFHLILPYSRLHGHS